MSINQIEGVKQVWGAYELGLFVRTRHLKVAIGPVTHPITYIEIVYCQNIKKSSRICKISISESD
jgi:hypothetical protein